MKVAIIGGGSTYTPELINGFIARIETFPLKELWLMDIDRDRLELVGSFAQRMVAAKKNPFKVVLTTDQRAAIEGSSYVITQLRVGKMQARRADEYLGQRYGLIGQETTGVGGMAKALRTIPVVLKIAQDLKELADPGALLVNFTNPAGLVTQALSKYAPDVAAIGVCNVPITTKMAILEKLEKILQTRLDPNQAELQSLGLNHLSWHRGFTVQGENLWDRLLEAFIAEAKTESEPEWDAHLIQSLGMIPNYYLQYFYYTDRKLAGQKKWPPSRAEEVMGVEKSLLKQYADPNLFEAPSDLMKRGGAYYSTVATQLLNAHYNNLGEIHVVNVCHTGAVPDWPGNWVLEMPCRIDKLGARPIPNEPLPPACFGLLAQVKAYELLTVEAAVNGDRNVTYQALLAHPLGPSADKIQIVLEDMLETNRMHLPVFWK